MFSSLSKQVIEPVIMTDRLTHARTCENDRFKYEKIPRYPHSLILITPVQRTCAIPSAGLMSHQHWAIFSLLPNEDVAVF